jgi:hypothetical protein
MSPPTKCPSCGAGLEPLLVGDMHDKFMFCPYCGCKIDVLDEFEVKRAEETGKADGSYHRTEVSERRRDLGPEESREAMAESLRTFDALHIIVPSDAQGPENGQGSVSSETTEEVTFTLGPNDTGPEAQALRKKLREMGISLDDDSPVVLTGTRHQGEPGTRGVLVSADGATAGIEEIMKKARLALEKQGVRAADLPTGGGGTVKVFEDADGKHVEISGGPEDLLDGKHGVAHETTKTVTSYTPHPAPSDGRSATADGNVEVITTGDPGPARFNIAHRPDAELRTMLSPDSVTRPLIKLYVILMIILALMVTAAIIYLRL